MNECPSCRDFGKEEFHADHWPTRKTSAHCSHPGCRRAALIYGTCDRHTPVGRPRRDGLVVFPGASKP